jgi:hypothetical protein
MTGLLLINIRAILSMLPLLFVVHCTVQSAVECLLHSGVRLHIVGPSPLPSA